MSDVAPEHLSPNQRAWRRFRRNGPAIIALVFLAFLLLTIAFLPTQPPNNTTDLQFSKPTAKHWFGTDIHGRDLFARVIAGGRVSLLVGAVGASVSLVIGVLWGAIAGYVGGRTDTIMMRVVDVLYSLPTVIFVIVMIALLNGYIATAKAGSFISENEVLLRMLLLFVGIGAVSWLTMSRIVRGQVLSLKNRQFIDASRSLGATHSRILFKHILPNVAGVILVYLTLTVPSVILYESFLSFLGMGVQPPMASWGWLISEGAHQLNPIRIYWWLLVFPCVVMIMTLLALNFLGDGLRDAFDPRAEH
ncbi:MAG TPA: ABC transporter permease [Candidatus Acidoferrum sp.]|nr:ABC transporter permease [Candidatus Acidoferrum sp.]